MVCRSRFGNIPSCRFAVTEVSPTQPFLLPLDPALGYPRSDALSLRDGYASAAAVGLAVERGEAEGIGSASLEFLESKPDWLSGKKIGFIYFIGLTRDPKFPDVPAIVELGKNDADRAVLKLLGVAATLGRSFATTPGTPPDRASVLRTAFAAMMRDPAFIADAEKRKIDLDFAPGSEMQAAVDDIVAMPDSVVTRYNAVIQPMD